jgi:pimeloyl-ACP methyl ester carboxylesterase
MESSKIHIYFVPGLAASSKIFEYLQFDENRFELHFLEWIIPTSKNESIETYAKRMANLVTEKKPVLIGVSFGGIMVQEMSKYLKTSKIIIISSVKSNNELPTRLKILKKTKAYKLFPSKTITSLEDFSVVAFGEFAKKRAVLYKKYLSVRNATYLTWAIYNVLHWQQTKPKQNILHIHGTEDSIFPAKNIKNYVGIKNGTHIMILNKAKEISQLITNAF